MEPSIAHQQLTRQGSVGQGTSRTGRVGYDRLAVARCLTQTHTAGNNGLEHLARKVTLNLLDDLPGLRRTGVEHRHHQPTQFQRGVEGTTHQIKDAR